MNYIKTELTEDWEKLITQKQKVTEDWEKLKYIPRHMYIPPLISLQILKPLKNFKQVLSK